MTKTPKTATFIRAMQQGEGWKHDARLYRLSEPVPYKTLLKPLIDKTSPKTDYIVVSSTPKNIQGQPETMAFKSDKDGHTGIFDLLTQAQISGENQFEEVLQLLGFELLPKAAGAGLPMQESSAELGHQLQEMDEEIDRCWNRVQELRKQRPALIARIVDANRAKEHGAGF